MLLSRLGAAAAGLMLSWAAACLGSGQALAQSGSAQPGGSIWFTPLTWNIKPAGHGLEYTQHDFPALLQPDAPWQTAASHVSVFVLPSNVVPTYPDLPGLIAFLNRRHYKVALFHGVLFSGGLCGVGLEGISSETDMAHEAVNAVRLWRKAGGSLDYFIMDTPFFHGRYHPKGCFYTTEEIARRTAATLAGIFQSFPDVRIVDSEGPGKVPDETWIPDMGNWFKAFQKAVGRPLDAVALDLHWRDLRPGYTWQGTAQKSAAYFHGFGVKTGIFLDSERDPQISDAQWMDNNRQHIRLATAPSLGLDFYYLAQWQNHVRYNLPESDPAAYTSLIDVLYDAIHAPAQ